MRSSAMRWLPVVLLLAACAPKTDRGAPGATLQGAPMMPAMTAHMDSLSARPAMLHDRMAAHTAMTEHFVAATRADAASLGAPGSASYDALADSVLTDLKTLATAQGAAWDMVAKAHLDRVHRLMAAYDGMAVGK